MERSEKNKFELEKFFNWISDGICISDGQYRIIYLNPAAERMLGVSLNEVQGQVSCNLVCGRLRTTQGLDCASGCSLRDSHSDQTGICLEGAYESTRLGKKSLRTHCFKHPISSDERQNEKFQAHAHGRYYPGSETRKA